MTNENISGEDVDINEILFRPTRQELSNEEAHPGT